MSQLSLSLLGTFHASVGDRSITTFRTDKVRALLAYLALASGQAHSRHALAALLWPDLPEQSSLDNLRVTLYRLRRSLDSAEPGLSDRLFVITRNSVQMNSSAVHVDVVDFEAGLVTSVTDSQSPLNATLLGQLAQSVALYRGELLAGFSLVDAATYEEWLLLRREQLAVRVLLALKTLADAYEMQGDLENAHTYATRLIELDPYGETGRRQLMRILALRGLPDQALAQYASLRRLLRDELGVEPNTQTVALYEQIRAGRLVAQPQPQPEQARPPVTPPLASPPQLAASAAAIGALSEIPLTGFFAGRTEEVACLTEWLAQDSCRLVAVLGLGGVGKTTLVAHAAHALAGVFEQVVWRALLNAPPLDKLLAGLLQALAEQPLVEMPSTLDEQLDLLIAYLRRRRVLLVLDNLETVLNLAQMGHGDYEAYNQLLRRVASSEHRSVLLFTSRERPPGLSHLVGESAPVRMLTLDGLDEAAGHTLLAARGVAGSAAASLVGRYSGNPLALKLVADTVQELFAGDVESFLAQNTFIFDDIRKVLREQIDRLTEMERSILFWLAVEREAVDVQTLRQNLVPPAGYTFLEALRNLQNRSLLERQGGGLALQNVVMEYLTERLVATLCAEIETGNLDLFHRHALLKAEARDDVRQSQVRLIVTPIAKQLQGQLGNAALAEKLGALLAQLHRSERGRPGYAAGNLLNLLLHLDYDVTGYDFSQLHLWQADLRGARTAAINLAGANLSGTTFTEDFGRTFALAMHPQGHLLAAGGAHGVVRLWSLPNGQNAGMLAGHTNTIMSVAWSPDGTLLASAGLDRKIRLWEWQTGRCISVLVGHESGIYSIAFHPDGTLLASGSQDCTLRLWDVGTGQQLGDALQHADIVNAVAFHPGGTLLASGGIDRSLYLWELSTGNARLVEMLNGHEQPISALAFSPDGTILASAGADAVIRLWDSAQRHLLTTLHGHSHWVRGLVFSPDGAQLISAGADRVIRIWDVAGRHAPEILHGHELAIRAIALHPDGSLLASGSLDDTIRLWTLRQRQHDPVVRTIRGHVTAIRTLSFNPDGALLAAGDSKGWVRLWSMDKLVDSSGPAGSQPMRAAPRTLPGRGRQVNCVTFSPDGKWLASGDDDRLVRIWEVSTLQSVATLQGHKEAVRCICFAPDGKLMATSGHEGVILLWESSNPARPRLLTRFVGHTQEINDLLFTPDGSHLISGAADYTLRVWNLATGDCVQLLEDANGHCKSLAFDSRQRLVAAAGWVGLIRLYRLNEENRLEAVQSFRTHATRISQISFHPDGQRLISGDQSETVQMWDVVTGRRLLQWRGHTQQVLSVLFHPQGQLLASGGEDATIRLWNFDAQMIERRNAEGALPEGEVPEGELDEVLRVPGPYAGMNIAGVTGISEAQRATLLALGAVEGKL